MPERWFIIDIELPYLPSRRARKKLTATKQFRVNATSHGQAVEIALDRLRDHLKVTVDATVKRH